MDTRRQELWYIATTASTPIGRPRGVDYGSHRIEDMQQPDRWPLNQAAPTVNATAITCEGR